MATFGKQSLKRLETCHPSIQKVMHEAIKHFDFTILYGNRSSEEQFNLYKIGRSFVAGKWVVTGKVVTNLDGIMKLSMHNHSPSLAIDIAPYPIDWQDLGRFKQLAKVVKDAGIEVGIKLQWGGDWANFHDYPHYEIKKV